MRAAEIFGPDGPFAAQFDGYEPRAGQIRMAKGVEWALEHSGKLLVEAPVATGKSFAYLAPIMAQLHAHPDRRAIICTANIGLQEQLIYKDIPALRRILGYSVPAALLKGISNYVCLRDYKEEVQRGEPKGAPQGWLETRRRLLKWVETTSTADRSDFYGQVPFDLWSRVSTDSEECEGPRCRLASSCYSRQQRRRAGEAQLIVTNYHILFSHVLSGGTLLPAHSVIVFDEAHKAPDIARLFFGVRLSKGAYRRLARFVPRIRDQILGCVDGLFNRLEQTHDPQDCRIGPDRFDGPNWTRLVRLVEDAKFRLEREENAKGFHVAASLLRRTTLVQQRDHARFVYFTSRENTRNGDPRFNVEAKLLHPAEKIEHAVGDRAFVATSATLTTAGKKGPSFAFVQRELGFQNAYPMVVDSPLDFAKQSMVVLPSPPLDLASDYHGQAASACISIVERSQGRALILCTSNRAVRAIGECLRAAVPYRVLQQGQAPARRLTEEFARDTHSILVGTDTFWAGIDVPGEALSCVVIDRFPFQTPADPVVKALAAKDPSRWFPGYVLPRAVLEFKQGVGRLIRSKADRGVIVILDPRVRTKDYGSGFVDALPGRPPVVDGFAEIERMLPNDSCGPRVPLFG